MNNILISIIIPTYNDWKRLALCINALSNQTFDREKFEVIVVNNNSHDSVPEDLSIPANCKIIVEEIPGSYAARNAAIKIAKGKIIGFTDSDCIPENSWIENAVTYFSNNSSCCRIAGKISIFFESSRPTKAELYDKLYAFNQKEYVENSGTSVTANMFTYKHLFDKIGLFDEKLMSGGDFSWGTWAHKHGYRIDFVENVVVRHPARKNLKELIKKEKRIGGSQAIFLHKKSNMISEFFSFLKELIPRVRSAKFILSNGKGLSILEMTYIYILRQSLLSIRAYEKFRVQTGKKANRA